MELSVKIEIEDGGLEEIEKKSFIVKNVLGLYQGQPFSLQFPIPRYKYIGIIKPSSP